MNHVIASSEADAHAAAAVEQHHAELSAALARRVEAVVSAAALGDAAAAGAAQTDLSSWCARELLPHARAEEVSLYPAAQHRPEGRLLVEGMLAEHEVIGDLVSELAAATDPVRAAAAARALQAVFASHLGKENDLILPLLVSAPDVSVGALLQGMHEVLGAEDTHQLVG
jgi:hypothetical protein